MKNMTKEEIFEAALQADDELNEAIGTEAEADAQAEAKKIMDYIDAQGWREDFDNYVQDM